MDWKDVLAKLKIIDITPKLKGEQVGVINIKVENKTFNYNFPSAKGVLRVSTSLADFEQKVKEEAERRLINLGISPDLLSESTRTEIASVVTVTSVEATIKIEALETLNLEEKAIVKLSPEPEPDK